MSVPPNIPTHFLYQEDGVYWYASHCCDFKFPHSGVIASDTRIDELGCIEGDPIGKSEVNMAAHSSDAKCSQHEVCSALGTDRVGDVRQAIQDASERIVGSNVLVTDIHGRNRVSFELEGDGEIPRPLRNVVFSLKYVQTSYILVVLDENGNSINVPIGLNFFVADRCRKCDSCRPVELTLTNMDGPSNNYGVFALTLKEPIFGQNQMTLLAKNPDAKP